jgi:hypothetical protein
MSSPCIFILISCFSRHGGSHVMVVGHDDHALPPYTDRPCSGRTFFCGMSRGPRCELQLSDFQLLCTLSSWCFGEGKAEKDLLACCDAAMKRGMALHAIPMTSETDNRLHYVIRPSVARTRRPERSMPSLHEQGLHGEFKCCSIIPQSSLVCVTVMLQIFNNLSKAAGSSTGMGAWMV